MKHDTLSQMDPLDGLWASVHRNGRMPRFPRQADPIFFDAERFRWWFRRGCRIPGLQDELNRRLANGCQINRIRRWMDEQIRKHEAPPLKEAVLRGL